MIYMKISTKVECGIIALMDIAVNSENGNIVKVASISKRNNISAKYLEQILPLLRQAKIIGSVKGASGGYVLTRGASDITLNEIINALDNTILNSSTFNETLAPAAAAAIDECLWSPVTDYLHSFSADLTLKALTDKYTEKQNEMDAEPMYYI